MRHAVRIVLLAMGLSACGSELETTSEEGPPPGPLTTLRTGRFVAQDEPSTRGMVSIAVDPMGQSFLALGDDFTTAFHTGSVALYLAATDDNLADQRDERAGSVSPRIATTTRTGAQTYALPQGVDASAFGTVVVYCEPAQVNFGAATLE